MQSQASVRVKADRSSQELGFCMLKYGVLYVSRNRRMAVGGISVHASLTIDSYCTVTPFILFSSAYCEM